VLDCGDGLAREWSLATGVLRVLHKHASLAYGAAWLGTAACSAGWDGRVLCTDGTGTRELRSAGSRVRRLVASSNELVFATDDGAVTSSSGAELYRHAAIPYAVAVSDDGRRIASGASDGSVIVYDATARRVRSSTIAHPSLVMALAWRDGELWTGGMDGMLKRWRDTEGTLAPIETIHEQGPLRFVRSFRDGWTCTVDGRILVVQRGRRQFRLDLDRHVERTDVSGDDRFIAAGTSGEVVVLDLARQAIAVVPLPSRGGYVGFANPGFLTISNARGLVVVPLRSLEYTPYDSFVAQDR
jgi:WD40 repeat protein